MSKKLLYLLNLAKGERKLNEYAMHAQIDAGNLSRILKGQQKPSPETLKKLAERAYNNVTYDQLMNAAGYFDNKILQHRKKELLTMLPSIEKSLSSRKATLSEYKKEIHEILSEKKFLEDKILNNPEDKDIYFLNERIEIDLQKIASLEMKIKMFNEEIPSLEKQKQIIEKDLQEIYELEQNSLSLDYSENTDIGIDEDVLHFARGVQKLKEDSPEDFDTFKRVLKSMSKKADEELNK